MLINGEKFACEACVRGHRVSSCQHQDRPLIHVNKKGRPVSQCQHCRGLRKARSQHVKCDCADKTHSKDDCPHDKGEKSDAHTCCCGHGARCNCSLKKEHLDTVPEDNSASHHPVLPKDPHKHRLSNLISHESKTTIFTNGHHKPVHKINDAHNQCGAPYKVPNRSHTVHGHREIAQRSTDSLPLPKTLTSHETPPHHESVTSAPQPVRMVKSEHGSPELKAIPDISNDRLKGMVIPPLDPNAYSYSPFENNSPGLQQSSTPDYQFPERFPESLFMSYEQAHDYEPAFPSAGLSEGAPDIDWSQFNFQNTPNGLYNLTNNNNNNNSNTYVPSQPPSYASFEHLSHLSHPGLTSSSGEISENEDYVPVSRPGNVRATSGEGNDDDNSSAYRLSSASSYIGMPQANMLANSNLDSTDIDEYMKMADEEARQSRLQHAQYQQQQSQYQQVDKGQTSQNRNFSIASSNLMGEHPYTIQEAQNFAHMNGNRSGSEVESYKSPMPASSMAEDPMWSSPTDVPAGIDADIDDDWVR